MNITKSLMKEHQLITRMIHLLQHELTNIKSKNIINTQFIKSAVEFLRTYADKCHHGKEEDILFKELNKKKIPSAHNKEMQQFIKEHQTARSFVKKLETSTEINLVIECIETLINLYTNHIRNENKYFYPILEYFSEKEHQSMLKEANQFDQQFDHEKYIKMIEQLEQKYNN